jgi:O-antigen ligase
MDRIKKFNLLLIYAIPFFLIFSHAIADGIVVLTGLTFLILLIFKKLPLTIFSLLKDRIIIYFILFYIVLILSSFFSEFQSFSLKRSIPYIRFIFFVAALKYWLFIDKSSFKILFYSILACLMFVCLDVVFQYFNIQYRPDSALSENYVKKGVDIFGYESKNYYRFQGPFKDEFIAGGFILKLSPFLFLIIFNVYNKLARNIFPKIFIFLSVLLITCSIFITGDRAPFFLLILIWLFSILIFFNKKIIFFLLFFITLIIFFFGLNVEKKQRYVDETLSSLGFQNNEFTLDTGYGHLFYSAIKIWIDKPLLGAGTKTYRNICFRHEYNFESKNNIELCSTHPHNYVLELLSEVGLLGLASFYLIFFYLAKELKSIKNIFKKNLDYLNLKFSTISLIIILWPINTTGSILSNKNSIILWFVFGIVYTLISFEKKIINYDFKKIRIEK